MCACDVPRRKAGSSCPLCGVEVSTLYNFQSLTLRATGQDWITTVRDRHTPYEDGQDRWQPTTRTHVRPHLRPGCVPERRRPPADRSRARDRAESGALVSLYPSSILTVPRNR